MECAGTCGGRKSARTSTLSKRYKGNQRLLIFGPDFLWSFKDLNVHQVLLSSSWCSSKICPGTHTCTPRGADIQNLKSCLELYPGLQNETKEISGTTRDRRRRCMSQRILKCWKFSVSFWIYPSFNYSFGEMMDYFAWMKISNAKCVEGSSIWGPNL